MLLKFISIFSSFPHWYLQRLQSFLAALNAEPVLQLFVSALESIVEEAQCSPWQVLTPEKYFFASKTENYGTTDEPLHMVRP